MSRTSIAKKIKALPKYTVLRSRRSQKAREFFRKSPQFYNFYLNHISKDPHPEYGNPVVLIWPDGIWAPCYDYLLNSDNEIIYQYNRARAIQSYKGA